MTKRMLALTSVLVVLPLAALAEETKLEATHVQAKAIAVKGENASNRLQTLCAAPTGEILALAALPRYGTTAREVPSEVLVYSAEGEKLRGWKLGFTAQSINTGPEGNIFVAGGGRIAEYSPTGSLLHEVDLPHLATLLKDVDGIKKRAEEQLKAERDSYQQMIDDFKKQKEALAKKDKEKLTASEKAQLKKLDLNLKSFEQTKKYYDKRTVDDAVKDITSRLRTVNAVAVTDKDVYVAVGETKGYGYAVWRMGRDLKEAKQVLGGLGGCCGQMDIQASGDHLYVAENTKHKVGHYTREGKKLGMFGKKGRDGDNECFGSCCNPMNVRIAKDGSVFTAESEGHVKHFDAEGKFLGPVGSAKLSGGCKNVALAVAPDGETIYFCDQPGSKIVILAKKTETTKKQ